MNGIYSLSISAQAIIDLHSLNNEGGEGNQIQTRMVNVVAPDGRLYNVNAISGDMWKHIQAEHLFRLATSRNNGVPLCAGCKVFNANRISVDPDFGERLKDATDAQAIDDLIRTCALDDLEGNLITTGNRSLPRKSVIEFGWVVGLPEVTTTDSYFHVKYANERSAAQRAQDAAEDVRQANLGQAIFHRPASSGAYAIVTHLELARIGFNDITQTYPISQEERTQRHRLLLESLCYALIEPNGAMRNTQNPHLVDMHGAITVSRGPVPAPCVSPLNPEYESEVEAIVENLRPLHEGSVELRRFGSLAEFTAVMADLADTEPAQLALVE